MAKLNPRLTDSKGARDGRPDQMQKKPGAPSDYKSPEKGGREPSFQATSAPSTPQLKRSTPEVGVYQSGNNERGGQATANRDTAGPQRNYSAPGLDALRAKQDRVAGEGKE